MSDFAQNGLITTLHDLGTVKLERLESLLNDATENFKIGLVLPVTAADMRAAPFGQIVEQLCGADYIDTIVVVLDAAPDEQDYHDARGIVSRLGDKAKILWTSGPHVRQLQDQLADADFKPAAPGKGRAVWLAFGYLLADPRLKAFVLHDCDIVDYDRIILARLCLPMAHPSLDFDFCKAFYARCTDRMHGRVVRLLVSPLLQALISVLGADLFLVYLASFRYPLAGEFAVTSTLARSNRIPSDWGLEVGTLAEVFRNTSIKRVCQVDLCRLYEHKHQQVSLEDPSQGLMKMATDILTTIFRTLASRGIVMQKGHFTTLRSAYLRSAQDAIRQYHADALMNGLEFDRHAEERTIEGFARQIITAGETFEDDPLGGEAIPNWSRVLAAFPNFPRDLRAAVQADFVQFAAQ
jgi:glucosyl-3-phosphoglycerate synthase